MRWYRLLLAVSAALLAAATAPALAHANTGTITNVVDAGGNQLDATFSATGNECDPYGYCGWYAYARQVPQSEACSVSDLDLVWVGDSHAGSSTETKTVRFYRKYTPTKLCLIVHGANGLAVVAEASWSPPSPEPFVPPALSLTAGAKSEQRLKAPQPGDRYNNLVTHLRCNLRCTVHTTGRAYYRAGGSRHVLTGTRIDDTDTLPKAKNEYYGFRFNQADRNRLARVMSRHGPLLWEFDYDAEDAYGQTDHATLYVRMLPPPKPRRPPTPPPPAQCTPGYSLCIPPGSDVDCAGGSGDGPRYVNGPVRVYGSDPYDLDRDGDGTACE